MSEPKMNEETKKQETNQAMSRGVEPEELEKVFGEMITNPVNLKNGHNILNNYESLKNFHIGVLTIIFNNLDNDRFKKLSCSVLNIHIRKNWNMNAYITNEEKLSILNLLMNNIKNQDYYIKNFIAKLLGLIAAREFPTCFESFIKIILSSLQNAHEEEPEMIDTYLRILINILEETDERIAVIAGDVLPIVLNVFKMSNDNQKNREKSLKIISSLFNKLSFYDGSEQELIPKILDNNELIEECLSLFVTILSSNPKFLFDIKKFTIRNLDILIRDMPIYSSKFFNQLIEPSWKLIVLELSLYTENVIFNKQVEYTEDEQIKIEDECHIYQHGYESEDDDEKSNLEGLVLELIDFAVDLLKRKGVMENLKSMLLTFLLCVKGYCMLPQNAISLWRNDPNFYTTEEFDEENINSIRNKTMSLIKEITQELDDESLYKFLKIVISEFTEGINIENYAEVIKLDDYNFSAPYFNKLNSDGKYVQRSTEANLFILGTLAEDLVLLRDKEKMEISEIKGLFEFLFKVIANSDGKKYSKIVVGRSIWCINRLLGLVRYDNSILKGIFDSVSIALIRKESDMSIKLIASQCLSNIAQKLLSNFELEKNTKEEGQNNNGQNAVDNNPKFDTENLVDVFKNLVDLLQKTSEETLLIPIETIVDLTKLNKEKALWVPYSSTKLFVDIYSKYYNNSLIGTRILDLIKLWCADKQSANLLLTLFVPFAFFVFDDFFKSLGKESRNFEEIKKTVMTEHGNNDMNFKTSLDMLPNLIDIISILMKYCVEINDKTNLYWISVIVNVICDIMIKSNDIQILQRASSFLRFYIPLCKETIESQKQKDLILKVIMRFFDPTLLESGLLYIGNVIAQYFHHIEKKIELQILEAIVRRIYKSKMPSIVQSLILNYSRFLIMYPNEILNFLTKFHIENKVGLKILIDKWLLHQPLFRGKHFKNVSVKALTILYEMKNEILETLMVIGYDPSHSTASVEVNAPFKILSVLIRCLNNEILQEKLKIYKNDYENLDYDNPQDGQINENDEFENLDVDVNENNNIDNTYNNGDNEGYDDNKKLDIGIDEFKDIEEEPRDLNSKLAFLNLQGRSGGLNNIETGSEVYLSEMLGFDYNDIDGEEEDDCEDDLVYLNNIDHDFNLKDFLLEFFKNFKSKDSEYLTECLKVLPKSDQEMFKNFNV